jgi:hypothetical protein
MFRGSASRDGSPDRKSKISRMSIQSDVRSECETIEFRREESPMDRPLSLKHFPLNDVRLAIFRSIVSGSLVPLSDSPFCAAEIHIPKSAFVTARQLPSAFRNQRKSYPKIKLNLI